MALDLRCPLGHAGTQVGSVARALVAFGTVLAGGADVARWAVALLHLQCQTVLGILRHGDLPGDLADAEIA